MQALWSRTAQAGSCQCAPCLQAAARVVRTNSTATTRRRLRASDVFTASFSAMLATAAVLDSRKKDKRISQWDQAIAEVRSGKDLTTITTPDQVSIGKAATGSSNIMGSQIGKYTPDTNIGSKLEQSATTVKQLLGTVPIPILEAYESSLKSSEHMAAVWDELMALLSESVEASADTTGFLPSDDQSGNSNGTSSATEVQNKRQFGNQLERGQFSAVSMKHREPQNQHHLDRIEREVYAFVCELWKTALLTRNGNMKTASGIHSVTDTAKDMELETKKFTRRIAALLEGSKPVPTYQLVSPVGTQHSRGDLNRTITSILKTNNLGKGSVELMVAKICYALLTSSVAPSITTYNIMIENFTRQQQYELAEVVVNTFKGSRFRPNERTLSAILDYYRVVNNKAMFHKTIRQMTGLDGGLGMTRRHIRYLTIPSIQNWALTSNVRQRNCYLQEKAHRNSQVFESLIVGTLHFSRLRAALRYMKRAIKDGCQIRTHVIVSLVNRCLAAKESGDLLIYLLHTLSLQWAHGMESKSGILYNGKIRSCIYDVLESCGLRSVLSDATVSLPQEIQQESFAKMLRHIKDEETKDLAAYRSRNSQLLDPGQDNAEFRISLLSDTPSFVKMSKIARQQQDRVDRGALHLRPPPVAPVEVEGAVAVVSGRELAMQPALKAHARIPLKIDYGGAPGMPQPNSVSLEVCI